MSLKPLLIEFDIDVEPSQAFDVWTRQCVRWWPASHTVSGDPASITFEPLEGGRIVERGPDGAEHDWGHVLDWEPPSRLRYRWHLFFEPAEATEVEVTFTPNGSGTTVRLEQRGFERLGERGPARRAKTGEVWSMLAVRLERFLAGAPAGPEGP